MSYNDRPQRSKDIDDAACILVSKLSAAYAVEYDYQQAAIANGDVGQAAMRGSRMEALKAARRQVVDLVDDVAWVTD